ncbi:MAG: ArsR family transcriptional regulator [Bacteroidota bacterium]
MKVKKLVIGIKSVDEVMTDFAQAAEALERGEMVKERKGLYFTNMKAFRRALSDQRLAILRAIRASHPASVYELAKIVKRDVKNVSSDLAILEEIGLVELKKTKTLRKKVKPTVPYDLINLDIAV